MNIHNTRCTIHSSWLNKQDDLWDYSMSFSDGSDSSIWSPRETTQWHSVTFTAEHCSVSGSQSSFALRCLKTKRLPPCQCLHMVNSSARKWSCLFSPFDLIHRHWRPGGRKTLWEYTRQNEKNWKNRHEMWINKNGISCCFILWYHTGLRLRRAGFSEESPFPVI